MKITFLINNKKSWMWDYIYDFKDKLGSLGYDIVVIDENKSLTKGGELSFFLGCTKIVPKKYLRFHKHNFVIHHSDLPKGRGSSPLVWQVIEGKNKIPFCLFEAVEEVDAGDIYIKSYLELDGSELLDEIFEKRWEVEKKMILKLLDIYPNINGIKQKGKATFYQRRNKKDDEISVDATIRELFNHFRIINNEKWPAHFFYKGHKYILKIYKDSIIEREAK